LDIGCGFGHAMGYHRDRGCRVVGVEADENARKIARRQNLDIRIGIFSKEMLEGETFDYVTLDQVIEHVQDPCRLLADVRSVLKKDGCVVIATPRSRSLGRLLLGTRWVHWHSPYHLQFFTQRSMQELARRNGFSVVSRHLVTTSEWLHYQWLHLVTRPPPAEPSLFWTHRTVPPRLKKWLRPLYVLHLIGINHLLGRILDSLRLGDNQVYLLRVSHDR
jgi:SAM-dependent methyltransferase